jgi:hypothetical protein
MIRRALAPLALVALAGLPALAAAPVRLVVNGRQVAADVPPQIVAGRAFLPLRATAEALGVHVEWMAETKTACLCSGPKCVPICTSGPGCEARIINGRVMVPLRKTAEMLGCEVSWDEQARAVHVTTPKSSSPS